MATKAEKTTAGLLGQSYRKHVDRITNEITDLAGCSMLLQRLTRDKLSQDQASELHSLGAAMNALADDVYEGLEALNSALYDDKIVSKLMGKPKFGD